jgi:hypothetical protein
VKRQREARRAEGWIAVKVWVPTERDAEDVRQLAAARRAKAKALSGLKEEVPTMTAATEARIASAIANQGSRAFTTPSGPVLTLLTELADEGDLASFSRAFVIFARAKPANSALVANAVPPKISNYLIKHQGVEAGALVKWTSANLGWKDDLKDTLRHPARFEQFVKSIAVAIKGSAVAH